MILRSLDRGNFDLIFHSSMSPPLTVFLRSAIITLFAPPRPLARCTRRMAAYQLAFRDEKQLKYGIVALRLVQLQVFAAAVPPFLERKCSSFSFSLQCNRAAQTTALAPSRKGLEMRLPSFGEMAQSSVLPHVQVSALVSAA